MYNIEGFYRSRSSRKSSYGQLYSRSSHSGSNRDYSYRRSVSPPAPIKKTKDLGYRQTSTTHTLGGTGGGLFWGWNYAPYYLMYPIINFAPVDMPTVIDLGDEKKEDNKK
jgi:hypothetical protein